MRLQHIFVLILSIIGLLAAPSAQAQERSGSFRSYAAAGGCIGGELCEQNGDELQIRLDGLPVDSVRFRAHDDVGAKTGARLRVTIDGQVLAPSIDVQKGGDRYAFDGKGLRGRLLTFEALADDEVVVEDIEVLYAGGGVLRDDDLIDERGRRIGWERGRGHEIGRGRGHARHRDLDGDRSDRIRARLASGVSTCIGGERCDDNGDRFVVRLDEWPVDQVWFQAHGDVGDKSNARLRVWIDDRLLAEGLTIKRELETFAIDADGLEGKRLVFEVVNDDEVVIEDLRVDYRGFRRAGR